MPHSKSFIFFRDFQNWNFPSFFYQVAKLRRLDEHGQRLLDPQGLSYQNKVPTIAMAFLEPSTRTQLSFQQAAYKQGFKTLSLTKNSETSLSKGESQEDTVLQMVAMSVDAIVVRAGDGFDFKQIQELSSCPVINGGWGKKSHPTQGLLDAFTVFDELGEIKNKKVLIVGDVRHSRCAISQMEIFQLLGAQLGTVYPKEFCPPPQRVEHLQFHEFDNLKEGLSWADVVISLRVQKERHEGKHWDEDKYIKEFQLSKTSLKVFSEQGILMAPGPINWGIEINKDVVGDSRNRILRQVYNGIFVRAALLDKMVNS